MPLPPFKELTVDSSAELNQFAGLSKNCRLKGQGDNGKTDQLLLNPASLLSPYVL